MSFPTTNWAMLADATLHGNEEGKGALAEMCRSYQRPVEGYLASKGFRGMDLEDLVQDFFFCWLKSGAWKRVERHRGRFRSFLLGAVNHMLAHHHEKHHAEKRGGGTPDLSLEQMTRDGFEVADAWPPPAPEFDREWALTLLSNTLMEIRRDFEKRDRMHEFEILSSFLPGGSPGMSLETASGKLGIEPATLKTWVHRLRGRFRERLRASVARTVAAPHEVDEELTYLRNLLAHDIRNSD